MIPGALAAMAACLLSGREDWRRRIPHFAFFGALGWSFGGSISYMQVIGYTHSGHLPSVAYGFACLFVIGFLWGAMGCAGTAMPTVMDRDRLTEFYAPILAIFAAWTLEDFFPEIVRSTGAQDRDMSWLYWHDTPWIAALLAIVAPLILAAIRRKWNRATTMILHMAVGWWIGVYGLVDVLGLRMTPPRGDSWAGCVGMTFGMIVYFWRQGFAPLIFASLVGGFVGGFGFSFGQFLKLLEISTGYDTNWHSVLEQSYGFINGIGVALAMGYLSTRTPPLSASPPEPHASSPPSPRRWTDPFAVGFTLLAITYVNIVKNVHDAWLPGKAVPERMYGLSVYAWFHIGYFLIAVLVIGLILSHCLHPLAILPDNSLGQGQLFYLLFLWWIVLANLSRDYPFQPQRLVTEGVIHVNACICTALMLILPKAKESPREILSVNYRKIILSVILAGLAAMAISTAIQTPITQMLPHERLAKYAGRHIRFGPDATIREKDK